jgi:hypothetical protein
MLQRERETYGILRIARSRDRLSRCSARLIMPA